MAEKTTFSHTVTGAGHITKGLPCEDYGLSYENDFLKIFAAADGHGTSKAPRAAKGAQFACEAAKEELVYLAGKFQNKGGFKKLTPEKFKQIGRTMAKRILSRWKQKASEDAKAHPFLPEEVEKCTGNSACYPKGEKLFQAYGTTLLAGMIADDYLILLQQGDGKCVLFDEGLNAIEPIEKDERCVGNMTTSMCDIDAESAMRFALIPLRQTPIYAAFVMSDGLEDSFRSVEMLHAWLKQLMIENVYLEREAVLATIPGKLNERSERASLDDVTLSGYMSEKEISSFVPKLELEVELAKNHDKQSRLEDEFESMHRKYNYLTRRYENGFAVAQQEQGDEESCHEANTLVEQEAEMLEQDIKSILVLNKVLIAVESELACKELHTISESTLSLLRKELERMQQEEPPAVAVSEQENTEALSEDLSEEEYREYLKYKQKYDGLMRIKQELQQNEQDFINRLNDLQ